MEKRPAEIELLTVNDYFAAFTALRDGMNKTDLLMLERHYQANRFDVTATELANFSGFPSYTTANLRYGLLGDKFLKFFQIHLAKNYVKVHALCDLEKQNGEWHWILMPKVVQALQQLNWFEDRQQETIFDEIEQFEQNNESLPETTRQSIIQSRIGQGHFREQLIEYWSGSCSVTGCQQTVLLRASHIKPWRYASNDERLNKFNGLLLIPNIDTCFDVGLISFDDDGKLLISNRLDPTTCALLGIKSDMRLSKIHEKHKNFLRYHREHIYRD